MTRVTENLSADATDTAINRVVEHYEELRRCFEQSARSGEPTVPCASNTTPAPQSCPDLGATTAPTGAPPSEPPFGGWDEQAEPIERSWEDQMALDVGIRRFGEI